MSISEEIERLSKLNADGHMTDEEFVEAKAKIISDRADSHPQPPPPITGPDSALNVNQWCMFIHFGQLAGFVVPFAGFVLPIVLWQVKKDESSIIDEHGKSVTNWLISALIYSIVSGILVIVVIGIFGLMALGIAGVVFAIIGGLKANEGQLWKYPLTIDFLK